MGIHGIFKEIGQGQRVSLLKLSSDHLVAHNRPLRIAIDTSIWLFQIQAGKGGSNPALRTFYYRLLRLLASNIHPLFVFDGPNKPLFKRNKKVGGPGVRVASVPEFLAKQLLKHFGFPSHVAPGEAEAECAQLQKEGIVDAVLSEDVDTLMFGSGVTLRNWSTENTSKTPTHVNVYRAEDTKEKSGLDRDGMILVALMSGGDYIPEGIPGCGPKVACAAARAGFAKELVGLSKRKDIAGMSDWRDRFQHEIRTNESKFFTKKNSKLIIPEDFPSQEVLGYYTHPCVSTQDKLVRLRESLEWDRSIDFAALRSFTADAFDWRCLSGAKKFVRNLAPAILVRELRLRGEEDLHLSQEAQEQRERQYISNIHGMRKHSTTDAELEYRVSFTPLNLVPIDLSIEEADDEFVSAGLEGHSEAESDLVSVPVTAAGESVDAVTTTSPSKKKRAFKPYEPDQLEKIWIMHSFLQIGSPLLIEDYEGGLRDPKQSLKQRRTAKTVTAADNKDFRAKKPTAKHKATGMPPGSLDSFTHVVKPSQLEKSNHSKPIRAPLKVIPEASNGHRKVSETASVIDTTASEKPRPKFRIPPSATFSTDSQSVEIDENVETPRASRQVFCPATETVRPFAAFAKSNMASSLSQKTPPRRKRRSPDIVSPALSQRTIESYYSPSPKRNANKQFAVIDLLSPSPIRPAPPRAQTPTPTAVPGCPIHDRLHLVSDLLDYSPGKLPDSVTKRRKRTPLKRHPTAPAHGHGDDILPPPRPTSSCAQPVAPAHHLSPPLPSLPLPMQKQKDKLIRLRESLAGSWKEVDVETMDLSVHDIGSVTTMTKMKTRVATVDQLADSIGWRASTVEVLDLTGV